MRLKFMLRSIIDSYSIKNKTCMTCQNLLEDDKTGNMWCKQGEHVTAGLFPISGCTRYSYLRIYKLL